MKTNKLIQFWSMLLVFLTVFGVGNAWGSETDVSTITSSSYAGLTKFWSADNAASNYEATRGAQWYGAHSGTTFTATGYANVSSISIECAKSSSGAGTITITAGSSSKSITSFNTTKTTETLTLASDYTGTITIEVDPSDNSLYLKSISVTYTPVPHTVNFSATSGTPGSSSLTEASGGAGVTLPNVTPTSAVTAAGWGFYGWATATVGTETTTAPTIVGTSGDTYYPAADITLYAVYAKGTYTKVTSMSSITSGDKCIIVGYDNNNTAVYAMTEECYVYNSTVERLKGKLIDTSPATTYSAAVIHANWRCEITYASTNQYYIQNLSTSKYVDTQANTDLLYTSSKYSSDHYTITYGSDGYCSILNNNSGWGGRYLVVFVGGDFGKNASAWDKMMIYKETSAPKYVSAPCTNIVTLSEGTKTNVSSITFSASGTQTCSSTDGDREVIVMVTTSTGYEMTGSNKPAFSKSSGTATATYVSGPTGSGPYRYVYRFTKDDSGAGTFSAAATAKTYSITLNQNSATTDGSTSVTMTYNSSSHSAITNPKKTHYIFNGWYSGSGGTGTKIIDVDGTLQSSTTYTDGSGNWTYDGTTTLYAKWTEHTYTNYRTVCSTTYDIELDKNGGDADGTATVAKDGTQLKNISAPTKTGYKVAGYYAESGKTNLVAAADGTLEADVEISSDDWTNGSGEWVKGSGATLYAKWEAISYSVRFNKNNGSATGEMSNESYDYGESKALTTNTFSLTGYTFAGWATTSDGDVAYDDKESVSNLSSTDGAVVDLYAIWTANKYTLTLESTGETSSVGDQTVQATYGSSMPLKTTADGTPAVVDPSKTGYTFDGWEYNSTQYYSYDAGEDEISSAHDWDVADNVTLTPRWNINSYTLTWNLDGGTVTEAGTGAAVDATGTPNSEVEYNAAITVPTVTKAGYTFAGWDVTPASNMPASDKTYTATWTALHDKYYDRMHETGGSTDASGYKYTDKSGAGYSVPSCTDKDGETGNIQCEKDHYKFLGWLESTYINDDGSLKDGATSHLIPASGTTDATGKTYYAIWGEE